MFTNNILTPDAKMQIQAIQTYEEKMMTNAINLSLINGIDEVNKKITTTPAPVDKKRTNLEKLWALARAVEELGILPRYFVYMLPDVIKYPDLEMHQRSSHLPRSRSSESNKNNCCTKNYVFQLFRLRKV